LFQPADIAAIKGIVDSLRQWDGDLAANRWEPALLRVLFDGIHLDQGCAGSLKSVAVNASSSGPVLLTASDPCSNQGNGAGPFYLGQPLTDLSQFLHHRRPLGELIEWFDPGLGRDLASFVRPGAKVPAMLRQRPPLSAQVRDD
jgi:hypothetical protein